MNGDKATHIIKLDKNIEVRIDIPLELDALEFSAIVEKARKLLKLSEVEVESEIQKPEQAPVKRKYSRKGSLTDEQVKELLYEYERSDRGNRKEIAKKYGFSERDLSKRVWYYKNRG